MAELGFCRNAAAAPSRVALVEPDGREVAAGELLARANRLVHGLRRLGLRTGHTVATVLPNGAPMIELYLAAAQAGWYLVPINHHKDPHKDPRKTADNRRDGCFTVGDVGYLDAEGYLFLCDRKTDMIISGGLNIYPAEVEAALLAHPAVGDVAVFGIPDEDWGEQVKAVIEPAPGVVAGPSLAEELLAFAAGRLAKYKCPRSIDFVADLPRDPNGKLYKRKLRDPYWAGRERKI
jgi:acyl-CoA synthetase (AMP-forming)/AMP-acid ligase II